MMKSLAYFISRLFAIPSPLGILTIKKCFAFYFLSTNLGKSALAHTGWQSKWEKRGIKGGRTGPFFGPPFPKWGKNGGL